MIHFIYLPIIYEISLEVYIIIICLAFLLYFPMRWIIKKNISNNLSRLILTWISAITFALIIYTAIIELFIYSITREPSRDFDQSNWMTNKEERFEMADDLIIRQILKEKDSTQVKLFIGMPNWQDSLNMKWTYDMGSGIVGFGLYFHTLIITFSSNKVIKVEHIRIPD